MSESTLYFNWQVKNKGIAYRGEGEMINDVQRVHYEVQCSYSDVQREVALDIATLFLDIGSHALDIALNTITFLSSKTENIL